MHSPLFSWALAALTVLSPLALSAPMPSLLSSSSSSSSTVPTKITGAEYLALHRRAGTRPTASGGPFGMAGAQSYPRATLLSDGRTLMGSASFYTNGETDLRVMTSGDGGATWSVLGSVTKVDSATHDTDNLYVLQTGGNNILAAFRNHDKNGPNPGAGGYNWYRITICGSKDGGKTWSYYSQATQRAASPQPNGLWEPFLRNSLRSGVQVYYSSENSGSDQDVLMQSSSDGGFTWSSPSMVASGDNTRDGMVGIAPVGNSGRLGAVFESESGGVFTIKMVTSDNDGLSWSSGRSTVYAPANGRNAQAPQVVNVGGTLVVSFMTNEDTGTSDDAVKLVTSGDQGGSWGNETPVASAPALWPGITRTSDSGFIVLYGSPNGPVQVEQFSL